MIDYKKSGVDVEAGDRLVDWLQSSPDSKNPSQIKTEFKNSQVSDFRSRVASGIGGFAALYDGRFQNMKEPLLVSCTDGVGTKVKLAAYFNDYSRVGQDLVGMCANDLICTGGTPLFFLDYYAVGQLRLESAQEFLSGVKKACEEAHMVLIGGETAEMPGVYRDHDFDCAGFSVGVVDRAKQLGPHRVVSGDKIIGLASSGYHSNGFSLIRKVFEGEYEQYREWLLEPTRLYVKPVIELQHEHDFHAVAHITGGGIENLPRVLPENMKASLQKWQMPECFLEVQKRAALSDEEMRKTFNCGIGLMIILPEHQAESACERLSTMGYPAQIIGQILEKAENEAQIVWQ